MSAKPEVFIFWDGDSAYPKATLRGFDVVKAIRAFAVKLGVIKGFRLYVDVVGAGPGRRFPAALASELQCSGVSIVDSVSNGRHGGSSKMLIADLFLRTMDYAEAGTKPWAALVVTTDPDVGYTLSLLRSRGQNIVLLCPSDADSNLLKMDPTFLFEGDMLETPKYVPAGSSPSHVFRSKVTSPRAGSAPSDGGCVQGDHRNASGLQAWTTKNAAGTSRELQAPLSESQQVGSIGPNQPPKLNERSKAFIACSHAVQMCTANGRRRCELFMELPDKRIYPDYYRSIPGPICINDILSKIDREMYLEVRQFVSDWTLLFTNARFYHPRGSQAFEDASAMEVAFRKAMELHFVNADDIHDSRSFSGSSRSSREEEQTPTRSPSPQTSISPNISTLSASARATLLASEPDVATPIEASSAASIDAKEAPSPLGPPSEMGANTSFVGLPTSGWDTEPCNASCNDFNSLSALGTPTATLPASDADVGVSPLPSKFGQESPSNLPWTKAEGDLEEEDATSIAASDRVPSIPDALVPASTSPSPSAASTQSRVPSFMVPSSLSAEDFPPLLATTSRTSLPSVPASTTAISPPVDYIPEHTIEQFVPLIAYLRERARANVTIYYRSFLVDELRAQKADIFPDGPPACIRVYVKDGLSLGVLRFISGNQNQVELSPTFRSAYGSVPSQYVTLVDFFRDRKAFGGTPEIDRAELQRELLERQSDIFMQANTAHFKKPIKSYIRKAAELQIVQINPYSEQVSLHPKYLQGL